MTLKVKSDFCATAEMTIESCCYCTDVDTDGSEHQRGIHISTSTLTGFLYAATKQVFLLIISHFLRLPFACIFQKDTKHTLSDRWIIAVHSAYCIFQQIMLAQRSMMLLLGYFLLFLCPRTGKKVAKGQFCAFKYRFCKNKYKNTQKIWNCICFCIKFGFPLSQTGSSVLGQWKLQHDL